MGEPKVKQIVLKELGVNVARALRMEAKRRRLSIGRCAVAILEEAVGGKNGSRNGKKIYHDLDHLAGTWSEKEAVQMLKIFGQQRRIDEDLWS